MALKFELKSLVEFSNLLSEILQLLFRLLHFSDKLARTHFDSVSTGGTLEFKAGSESSDRLRDLTAAYWAIDLQLLLIKNVLHDLLDHPSVSSVEPSQAGQGVGVALGPVAGIWSPGDHTIDLRFCL